MEERKYGDENGMCVLDETIKCDGCGECDRCDLDPNKICDNCLYYLRIDNNSYCKKIKDRACL